MKLKLLIISIIIFLFLITTGCFLKITTPDGGPRLSLITPESTYYLAQGGMIALMGEDATIATIICQEASETLWPILESASGATIELKDEVVNALITTADRHQLKDKWLQLMGPALGFLNATFQPEVTFKDNWLEILRGFTGGIIDACEKTNTHRRSKDMPGFDGTGPNGEGSFTGRGLGYCVENLNKGGISMGYIRRGKRDGTGPHKDSLQRKSSKQGRRKQRGEKCPHSKGRK